MQQNTETQSFIIGKDAPLESTIALMQATLLAIGFDVEEKSWLNPVENIWSVHVAERSCPLMFTNGKGAKRLAALASALGEFFERISNNYFWTHYYLGEKIANQSYTHYPQERWFPLSQKQTQSGKWPKELLTPELHAFYNPENSIPSAMLVDHNSGNTARGICAIPYICQRDGSTVWFPVNIIANLYVSNGMSAGNTPAEARTQALAEIFERFVKFKVIAEGLCLPEVPDEVIACYPRIAADIADLRAAGFGLLVKDASLGGEYPVMNVTLLNPHDQGVFSSFGAHPRFEIALERALTELLQGRGLDALGGFPEAGFDLEEIASSPNIEIHFVDSSGIMHWNFMGDTPDFAFVDWNFSNTTEEDYQWSINRIHQDDCDAYIADFTHLGVYACRVLVPSMSEIYPIDDLEWENTAVANAIRPDILNLSALSSEQAAELLEKINETGVDEQRTVASVIGLAADAGTLWEDMRVAELKTLLALAAGDTDATLEGCDWIAQFGQLNAKRKLVYNCVSTLLQLEDSKKFNASLISLYGENTLKQAQALINGENRFFGLDSPGLNLEGCNMHQRLLAAYNKMHKQPA
ncbi:MAG: YcaO-like family protein [Methylophilaceae bacterium]|nr:YcaO-like family protein [Methylophilaceae bacterium]